MVDTWVGLCNEDSVQDVRRALRHIDPQARLMLVSSPQELRARMQESPFQEGAIVGPLKGNMSSLNVAAALVRDAMAADVALVVPGISKGFAKRAERAGIRTVVDLSELAGMPIADLDEPALEDDDVPTMLVGVSGTTSVREARVPRIDEPESNMLTFPLLREGKHGPEVEHISVPREFAQKDPNSDGHSTKRAAVEESNASAPIITFVSGRGGVGKTTVVAMMATLAASWDMRVAICDLDLSCGNLYSCFQYGAMVDLADLVRNGLPDAEEVLAIGRELNKGLTLWGPCERPEMAEVVYPEVQGLLGTLAKNHDLVLVDTSSTFTDAVAQAAQQCDRLIITVDGRPGSAASQARMAALAVRLGVPRTRMVRLANRCGLHGRGEPVINRADVGLETARPLRVSDGGIEVSDCLAEGKAQDLIEVGSRFAESSATALAIMLSELGKLPKHPDAQRYLQKRDERPRWSFGRKREAV